MEDSKIPHYYVEDVLFIDYMEAVEHCDRKNISYDRIVKTTFY